MNIAALVVAALAAVVVPFVFLFVTEPTNY